MENNITEEQFLADVKHEVETIKEIATKEEIEKLDFEILDPNDFNFCIYGQMTGHCRNKRATELISKACVRVTINRGNGLFNKNPTFSDVKFDINGPYEDEKMRGKIGYLSMIETYIYLKDSKPKNIISYLKGEVETLEL